MELHELKVNNYGENRIIISHFDNNHHDNHHHTFFNGIPTLTTDNYSTNNRNMHIIDTLKLDCWPNNTALVNTTENGLALDAENLQNKASQRPSVFSAAEDPKENEEAKKRTRNCCACFKFLLEAADGKTEPTPIAEATVAYKSRVKLKFALEIFLKLLMGFFLSSLICSSWVLVSVLMNKVVNDIRLNETTFIVAQNDTAEISCDFCYIMVWVFTSGFTMAYPVYFMLYMCCYKNFSTSQKVKKEGVWQFLKSSFEIFVEKSSKTPKMVNVSSTELRHSRVVKYVLKVYAVAVLWNVACYSYLRAIDLVILCDAVALFSMNISFKYISSWIGLQSQFVPVKVIFFWIINLF